MVDEEKYEYKCKIFCIYFKNGCEKEAIDTLEKIAKEGKTDKVFDSNSLKSLTSSFLDISDIIQKNYKLELNTTKL